MGSVTGKLPNTWSKEEEEEKEKDHVRELSEIHVLFLLYNCFNSHFVVLFLAPQLFWKEAVVGTVHSCSLA